jgi:hypothetical protein
MLTASYYLLKITDFASQIFKSGEPGVQDMLMEQQKEALRVWRRDWIETDGTFLFSWLSWPVLRPKEPRGKSEAERFSSSIYYLLRSILFYLDSQIEAPTSQLQNDDRVSFPSNRVRDRVRSFPSFLRTRSSN